MLNWPAVVYGVVLTALFCAAVFLFVANRKLKRQMEERAAQTRAQEENLHRISEELKQVKEAAEISGISKSQFLANIGHEIRTPMNAIIGISNILQTQDMPPEKQRECIKTLVGGAESLLNLINELMDISRIEIDKIELDHIRFDLKDLIEEVIALLSVRAKEKSIAIKLHYDASMPSDFTGDPLRMRQVLTSLLSNAVKYTEHGDITIHVAADKTSGQKPQLILTVRDSGAALEKRKNGGVSLGVTVAEGLTEKMNGTLTAQNAESGCEFIVRLPLPAARVMAPIDVAAADAEPAPSNDQQKWILLAEDYDPNILVATTYLENLGYPYIVAKNGREAVEKYGQLPFALILMDVQMPEMDGYDAARLIREQERKKGVGHTPIVGMTAFAQREDREKCMRAGMDEYIAKPFRPGDLKTKIEKFLPALNS